ncbi:MAG: cytochrome-c peroxidase [Bacteroidia bacterium]|nr:MAG: cytochrome-c peroxidase [Bacteroidia bacterium]
MYKIILALLVIIALSAWKLRTHQKITAIELGKKLFFDPILSSDSSVSCASCHNPKYGFADNQAFSVGVGGKKTSRNTPSVLNMKNRTAFFWDGRASTLEEQALGPIQNPDEMNLPIPQAIQRLKKHPFYAKAFLEVYGKEVDSILLGKALAAFEETLEIEETRMDQYLMGNENALNESEKRGLALFNGKAGCIECHFGPDFTNDQFKNIGLYTGKKNEDLGRYNVTKNKKDKGKFKVPGLRNIIYTAPYMHDGRFKTLEEVIDYYNNPDIANPKHPNRDKLIKPLNLTTQEKKDLIQFLQSASTDKPHPLKD